MRCPQCDVELETTDRHRCPTCKGVFVGDDELNRMLAALDAKRDPPDRRTTADWLLGDHKSERRCPACSSVMYRITLERVIVERCGPHGVWFDRDELQRVMSPNVDEHGFAVRSSSEQFELGTLGTVVQLVYSQIRRTPPG